MPIPEAIVDHRFRLVRELGRGGMGAVWLAHHLALDIPCAVKFLDESLSAPGLRDRFEAEARSAARLRSPHVVQILDHGVWENRPYIAMEYLQGEDLAGRLQRRGRLEPRETATLVAQVARALGKAHALGIVHRDLKPANIFLVQDEDGLVAKVLDFGIAKVPLRKGPHTLGGQLLGTPEYMSPEQARGLEVDHRSDLWSLAVIAFECLTGGSPFAAAGSSGNPASPMNLVEQITAVATGPLPRPRAWAPDLPPAVDAWWGQAASRDPAGRFGSARELARALAQALGVSVEEAGPPSNNLAHTATIATSVVPPPPLHTEPPSGPAPVPQPARPGSTSGTTVVARSASDVHGERGVTHVGAPRGRMAFAAIAAAAALVGIGLVARHRGAPDRATAPSAPITEGPAGAPGRAAVADPIGPATARALPPAPPVDLEPAAASGQPADAASADPPAAATAPAAARAGAPGDPTAAPPSAGEARGDGRPRAAPGRRATKAPRPPARGEPAPAEAEDLGF